MPVSSFEFAFLYARAIIHEYLQSEQRHLVGIMPDVILCPCLIRFPFHIAGGAGEHAAAMPLAFLGHPPLDLLALPLLLGTGLCRCR